MNLNMSYDELSKNELVSLLKDMVEIVDHTDNKVMYRVGTSVIGKIAEELSAREENMLLERFSN